MSSEDEREEKFDSSDPIVLRALVTGPEAGSIIGKKGDSINNIRGESKAKVNIFGDSKDERLISVEGKTDSIFKAYTMICKVLESRSDPDASGGRNRNRSDEGRKPGEIQLKLLIPTVQAGPIIGKGGENIKDMRNSSGAEINFHSDPLPGSTEREFSMCGTREQVTKCIFSVVSILLENPPKDGKVRLYQPMEDRDRDMRDSHRDRDRMMREERMRPVWTSGYSGSSSSSRDRRSRRDDTPPRWGGGSMGGGTTPAFNILMDFARSHSGSRNSGGRSSRDSKYEMYVNNDQVGAVIGRKGSKINEIRQLSGASINVREMASRSSSDPDRERVIEISGSQEQVALAKSLINVAVELGDTDRDRGGDRGGRRSNLDRSRSRERYDSRRY